MREKNYIVYIEAFEFYDRLSEDCEEFMHSLRSNRDGVRK